MTSDTSPASEGLAELLGKRDEARGRLAALEDEQRAASAAVVRASDELVALERAGGPVAPHFA
jgi:hypothetical protein